MGLQVFRVAEKQDQVDLVVGDAGADLLAAALVGGQAEVDGQTGGAADQLPRRLGRGQLVLGQDAAVSDAELHHQFFFSIVAHQCDVHSIRSFFEFKKTII